MPGAGDSGSGSNGRQAQCASVKHEVGRKPSGHERKRLESSEFVCNTLTAQKRNDATDSRTDTASQG